VKIHPSSVLMSKKVPAILYDELVSTVGLGWSMTDGFHRQSHPQYTQEMLRRSSNIG
jgi:hypothetical protein